MDIHGDPDLLRLLRRAHPGFFSDRYEFRVMVRDEYRGALKGQFNGPGEGWRDHNQELVEWLNNKKTRLKRIDAKGVHHMEHTDFDWMHLYGCYAMNDKAIAAEFRLLFG